MALFLAPPLLLYASEFSACSKYTLFLPFFRKICSSSSTHIPEKIPTLDLPRLSQNGRVSDHNPVLPRNESSSRETTAEIFRSDEPWAMATSDTHTNPQAVEPREI